MKALIALTGLTAALAYPTYAAVTAARQIAAHWRTARTQTTADTSARADLNDRLRAVEAMPDHTAAQAAAKRAAARQLANDFWGAPDDRR